MRLLFVFLVTAVSFFALGYKVNDWLLSQASLSNAMVKARDAVNAGMVQESHDGRAHFFWPSGADIPLGFKSNIGGDETRVPLNVGGVANRIIFYAKPVYRLRKYVVVYDNATVGIATDEPSRID